MKNNVADMDQTVSADTQEIKERKSYNACLTCLIYTPEFLMHNFR